MHPKPAKNIDEIFRSALEHPPEDRAAFLDKACGGDLELRRQVQAKIDAAPPTIFMELPFATYREKFLDFGQSNSLTGRELNHYRIGPLIGAGGVAEVYRARDTKLSRDVAIKVLHSDYLFDEERSNRLYREAQVLASLNHPNIASVYSFEEADGVSALVLELVEGQTLAERISDTPVPVGTVLDIAVQIAAALEAAHSKAIIHRDLTPSNIKLTPGGVVKVLDFGIAKLLRSSDEQRDQPTAISNEAVVLGTVAYMSPEQARGKVIDTRTDIWAFGCLLYEALTGTAAFHGVTPTDIVVKIATEEPDWNRLQKFPEAVSPNLQRLIRKCLQKDPSARYQSVRELAIDLEAIRNGNTTPFPDPQHDPDLFVIHSKSTLLLFMFAQFGYLALYGAAMLYLESIGQILSSDFHLPGLAGIVVPIVLAGCGVAVRIYLIAGVGWGHPSAGKRFHKLFPALLILDSCWAASPLLLWSRIYGLAFICVALLAYVPFAQRTLIRGLYPTTRPSGFSRLFE